MPYSHLSNITSLDLEVFNLVVQELAQGLEAAETSIADLPNVISQPTVDVLNKTPADGTAAGNVITEITSFSCTVVGGTLGPDGKIGLFSRIKVRNHASATQYCTIRVKFGGTTVLLWTYSGGDGDYAILTIAGYIMGDNDLSAQIASGMRVQYSAGAFTAVTEIGSASVTSTSDQTLAITLQWDGTGGADQNAYVEWANVVAET